MKRQFWRNVFVPLAACLPVLFFFGCSHKSAIEPPPALREFRGVWVATVDNIDWPSKKNLSTEDQQKEMRAILDRCVELKLNAVVFQVRTSADALYKSDLEPWSEYLTGTQGKAPEPFYDPLAMWVEEAHKRGLELHAWFNPFRARAPAAKTPEAPNHIAKTHPDSVKKYGNYLWMDPGDPIAREQTLAVFRDVVKRYDIDGIHIDDYFYPYPIGTTDFPDDASWKNYQQTGGKLSRPDWRRDNINQLIEKIYEQTKKEKPLVKFGISPFGIWQPGYPPSVKGFNQYASLYADAKLWLNKGWCDYFTPQLYWRITATSQPYKDLLDWWIGENKMGRNIYPGLAPYRVNNGNQNWPPSEIVDQIEATRQRYPNASGQIHFSMKTLMNEKNGVANALYNGPYANAALVPPSKWLDNDPPPRPWMIGFGTALFGLPNSSEIVWASKAEGDQRWLWAVYIRRGSTWMTQILPGHAIKLVVPNDAHIMGGKINLVAVSGIDRNGNEGRRAIFEVPNP